jgi:hypothetical protein
LQTADVANVAADAFIDKLRAVDLGGGQRNAAGSGSAARGVSLA